MNPVSNKICSFDGCDRRYKALGYCDMHYHRHKSGKDMAAPVRPRTTIKEYAPGGWFVNHYGYIARRTRVQNGNNTPKYELQHRIVMAEFLGRALLPTETPHHLNGDRTDNRIENLELWSVAQPSGQRVENKVAYALEILRSYAPEYLTTEARKE